MARTTLWLVVIPATLSIIMWLFYYALGIEVAGLWAVWWMASSTGVVLLMTRKKKDES